VGVPSGGLRMEKHISPLGMANFELGFWVANDYPSVISWYGTGKSMKITIFNR